MLRTTVLDESGTDGPATGSRMLTRPVGPVSTRRYRHLLRLDLPVPEGCAVSLVDAVLRGAFVPFDHDALHPPSGLDAATTGRTGPFLTVDLPGPRRVLSVVLSASAAPGGSSIELHRLDGDTPGSDPTVVSGVGGSFAPSFVDVRFAVGLLGMDSERADLQQGDLQEVRVRSLPTGATLDVAPSEAEPGVPAVGFWRGGVPGPPQPSPHTSPNGRAQHLEGAQAGDRVARDGDLIVDEFRRALADPEVPFDVGPKLVDTLRTVLAAGATEATLVLEADAPCAVRIDAFSVTYHAALSAFDGLPAEDQVLQFDGARLAERSVQLRLPRGSTVSAATVDVRSNLRADRATNGDGMPPLGGGKGVELVPGRTALAPLPTPPQDPPRAILASGLVVAAIPMADDTSLVVSVQEDRDGSPSGADLARGTMTLGPAGEPSWFTAPFATPAALTSIPYWIVIRTASGRAIWLADAGAGPAIVIDEDTGVTGGTTRSAGVAPRAAVLAVGDPDDGPPMTVLVGEARVSTRPTATGGPTIDSYVITGAVNAALAASEAPSITIPVRFISASSGTVTVAPPSVEFDVAPGDP